jgi:hypothetical protein
MLRLVLNAFEERGLQHDGLGVLKDAKWYCEVLMRSRFRPKAKVDTLAEGLTNADAVIGDFEFGRKTALRLSPGCRQFLVICKNRRGLSCT